MIIRKKFSPLSSVSAARGLVIGAVLASLGGCGMIGSVVEGDKVDYKSAKKASTLDVPPDLTQLQRDNRYAIPDNKSGIVTASGYNAQLPGGAAAVAPVAAPTVALAGAAPPAGATVRVERDGNARWLVVKQTPEMLWPQLKTFWEDSGFTLALDLPGPGIMETEWNENRAKLPQDVLRDTLGKVFDGLYSTGERDKYRTRLERRADGSSEIYISQRGMIEVITGVQKDGTMWTERPNDPALEAQFLARLMTRLGGGDAVQASSAVAAPVVVPEHAKLAGPLDARYVEVDEGFDRAWRRVGLALDRVAFTVEDRDRTMGLYFVRYADPDLKAKTSGFLKNMFGSSDEKNKEAQRYRVAVKGGAGSVSVITVLNNDGQADTSPTAEKILGLLNEQLK